MSLSVSLANALSGMKVTQRGLDVVSRNVSNASTPGYHRQSLSVVDGVHTNSSNIYTSRVERALNRALESQTNTENSTYGYAQTRASFLTRLEGLLGTPGDSNSIATLYNEFSNSLNDMATSPDDFTTRAEVLNHAQGLVESLHYLSDNIQLLRQETEQQVSAMVVELNDALSSLAEVNTQLQRYSKDDAATNALHDDRDRLVQKISEMVDVRVAENPLGGISIHTRSGMNLLDGGAAQFEFTSGGLINGEHHYNQDNALNEVGTLTVKAQAGSSIDLVRQNVLQSGSLKALIDMRDGALAGAQAQLDDIAAALSLALSTKSVEGTAATAGAANGFDIDLAGLQAGNATSLTYTEGGVVKKVSIVRVDDTSQLPMDSVGANGVRTIGVDFSGGATAAAAAISAALGSGVTVTNPSGDVLRFMDDGVAGTTSIDKLAAGITVTGLQDDGLSMAFFTDGSQAFTGSLDGQDQKVGFAARIQINTALVLDNKLMVQHSTSPETNIGDDSRPNFLVAQLGESQFAFGKDDFVTAGGTTDLVGTVRQLIDQSLNFQGSQVAAAKQSVDSQQIIIDSLEQRAESDYGVDIDTEMARLMDLQNAYAANARIITIVQEMMDRLFQI